MQGFEPPDTCFVALSSCCYASRNALEALERNFAPLFLLAPAAAASEPAPGQPAEVLRARKRPFSAALAEPIPGQLLGLNFVSVCKVLCSRLLVFFIRQACLCRWALR
jgi:hypothetical protein